MITAIFVLCVLIVFLLIWIAMILNNGFAFTNKNIDNLALKNTVLVNRADEVISKYRSMMKDIENSK